MPILSPSTGPLRNLARAMTHHAARSDEPDLELGGIAGALLGCAADLDAAIGRLAEQAKTARAERDRLDRTRPTEWAYEQACAAIEKHRERADASQGTASDDLRPLYDAIESGAEGGDWPTFLAALAVRDAAVGTAEIREQSIPSWEAVYEPGNVSDYLIGYTNDELPAKAAAEAWFRSQYLDEVGELVWTEQVYGSDFTAWFDLTHIAPDGDESAPGITVRCAACRPTTTAPTTTTIKESP
jgi:hypothetical protein